MAKLDDKVAVITGASSGIGEATAEALAAEGAAVVVAARREERLEDLVGRINGNRGKALGVACDVTDEQQAHDLIKRGRDEFGRVDILVNNAGVMQLSKVQKGLSDEWRTMFEVNVLGLLYATDAAIEVMKEQGSGHLVNISSLASRGTRAGVGVYSGTKMAVNGISESLRQELPDYITDEEAREGLSSLLEQLDPLKAEDIANAVVYVVTQPERVSINEILIRPSQQPN
jgi:NADP-dependent 3-hydroxy acid dehydrogenase YdfG